jgi:4-amino-4-deoxy-L-arabinose transferase-like glycosyltransferase
MLYMLGMGLGSDIFARLIHFSTLILFLLATYGFGRRFLPKSGGWLAAAMLLGIPILPLWGNAAYTDIAWALFQFLAIALFLVWFKERNPWLLGLSGVMQGLALGSKYLAFSGAGVLLVFVVLCSLIDDGKWTGWIKAIRNGMIFGLGALVVALPWYLKNYIWTGNPVFPLYLPQHVIDPTQLKIWMDYVNSFGTGKNWYDYLLLPINIYLQHDKFGTFMGSMEMPSPLFLFGLAYPLFRKSIDSATRKILDILGLILIIQFILWTLGSQQNRFLLPLFPGLSILASMVLVLLTDRFTQNRLGNAIKVGSVSGMVFVTLIFMGIYVGLIRPDRVLLGIESKQDFLTRVLRDYPGISYVNDILPNSAVPFFLWDGRGYYCKNECLADVDQSRWSALIQNTSSLEEISSRLHERNITHVFFSKEDITFFLLKHDQKGEYLEATKYLLDEFVPKCTSEIYTDEWVQIFEINYDNEGCQ